MLRVRAGEIDLTRRLLLGHQGVRTTLTAREAALLGYLSARPGRTVERQELLEEVWQYHRHSRTRAVDHTMRRLRAKVELDPAQPEHLLSDYGNGYRFVPLPAAPGPAHSAPWVSWGTRFFGRLAELAELRTIVASARCCLVVGRAGMGKTRLARQLAWERRAAGHDARVVGLADAENIETAIALALDLPAQRSLDDLGAVLAAWGPLCLILDEADEVLPTLAPAVIAWAEGAPDLIVVATSRRDHEGIPSLQLDGLTPDAACAVLLDRSSLAGVEQAAPPMEELRALAEEVDRVPLALELVAPRLRLMGAARLARLLQQHSTDAVRSSVRALGEADRAALAILARFRHPFTLDLAAEALGSQLEQELDRLQRLVDQGLLSRRNQADDVRLAVLAPVRAAALVPDVVADLAHARAVAAEATRTGRLLRGPRHQEGTANLIRIRGDLVAAWQVAHVHEPQLAVDIALGLAEPTGRVVVGAVESILARSIPLADDAADRARLHLHRARVRIHSGAAGHDEDLAVAMLSPDEGVRLAAAQMQAIQLADGPEVALQQLDAIANHWQSAPLHAAKAERAAAVLEERRGELDAAAARLDRALRHAVDSGHPGEIAAARLYRGVFLLNRGRPQAAHTDLLELEGLPATQGADGRGALGFVQAMLGDVESAVASMDEAVAMLARTGESRLVAYAICNKGSLLLFLGQLEQAASALRLGVDRAEAVGAIGMVGACRRRLATVQHLQGDLDAARDGYQAAMPELEAGGHVAELALAIMQDGLAAATMGDATTAHGAARRAWRRMPEDAAAPMSHVLEGYEALVAAVHDGSAVDAAPVLRELCEATGGMALADRSFEGRVLRRLMAYHGPR